MENWKRKIFFWTLVILFVITVPVVIFNAKGYRFDKNRGVFVYSGTITFKSNPQSVEVKLNNELFESKKINRINGSYNLAGLLPMDYNFEVSAQGFQTWKKKVDVHSGLSSEFWNILLVKNNYEKADLNTVGIQKFFTSPKNDFLAYVKNSNETLAASILNLDSNSAVDEIDLSGWQFIEDERKENIEWSPDESYLSIPVKKTTETENLKTKIKTNNTEYAYFIYDLENKNKFNLNEFLGKQNITNVRWDPKEKGYLFFLENNSLFRVNIKDPKSIIEIASETTSYELSDSSVYYSKISNLLFKNNTAGSNEPIQLTSNFPDGEDADILKLVVYDDFRIALILKNGSLYILNKGDHGDYFRKLGSGIQETQFSNDGKKLLFWSNNEVSIYFTRDQLSQPVRDENEMENVTRYSGPIKNVQWFLDYEHIIFSSGRWIKIIEIDMRDHANCMDIANTEIENPFVIYNGALEKLYFIDNKNDTTSLYSINFPEKSSFLDTVGFGQ